MFLRCLIPGIAATLAAIAAPAAAGSITVCNEGDREMRLAMVWNEGDEILFPRWISQGWVRIEPGQCNPILRTLLRQYVFLAPLRVGPGPGNWISRYALQEHGPLRSARNGSYGIERFFCVQPDAFRRQTTTLEEQQTCPEGWHGQLFTLLAVSDDRSNLTLRLK